MGVLTARLATIPALAGRIHVAAKLSALMQSGGLLQVAPAAFELPLGFRAMPADAAAGMYRQSLEWLHGVVLVVRAAGDTTGAAGTVQLEPLIDDAIRAIAGWAPPDAFDTFEVRKGELVSLSAGVLAYQLDFSIKDQLRISR